MKFITALITALSFIFLAVMNSNSSDLSLKAINDSQQEPKKQQEEKKYPWESEEKSEEAEEEADQKPKYNWDDDEEEETDPKMKYYKEKYEESYNYPFEVVWNAVKKALEAKGCMVDRESYRQDDEGYYKGKIRSDMCVFVDGTDSSGTLLKKYSVKMPFIRGGIWKNGRFQYKFIVKENPDGTVYLRLKGEMSGYEDHITQEVHFWDPSKGEVSTGLLEAEMFRLISEQLEKG